MPAKITKIEVEPINEMTNDIIPLNNLAKELGVKANTLRCAGIRHGVKFYKFANVLICVNKKDFLDFWNKPRPTGRPKKETK